jgi:ABC-2 type transport system permease protein
MFWIIAGTYCRLLIRERVLPVALVVFVAAMIYPILRGQRRIAEERLTETAFLQRAHEVVIRNQQLARGIEERIAAGVEREQIPPPFGTRHPRYAATWSRPPAILPISSLSWLATGQSRLYAAGYAGPEHDEIASIANPLKLRIGDWDMAFAAVYLVPLFVFALGFDLIASDRETGRLQLALSQPVHARTILRARAFATAVIVIGAVALVYAAGVAVSDTVAADGMFARAMAGGLAIAFYAIFWLALTVAINTVGQNAAENAMDLMALWLLFVILIPFVIDQIATRAYPVPAHSEVTDARREAPQELQTLSRDQLISEYLRHQPSLPASTNGLSDLALLYLERTARAALLNERIEVVQQRWEDHLAGQQVLVNRLAILSPAALLTSSLTELAGTSRSRYLDFVRQKRDYDESYERYFLPMLLALPNSIFQSSDYDRIPTMHYSEMPAASVWRGVVFPFIGLAVIAAVAIIIALKVAVR